MSKKPGRSVLMALVSLLSLALLLTLAGGCGGENKTMTDEIVDYVIRDIIVPSSQQQVQIVELKVYPEDGEAYTGKTWKVEGGNITEISQDEYDVLKSARDADNENIWTASQHSIRVRDVNEDTGEAIVEVGNIYGPMNMQGAVYRLQKQDGNWTVIKKDIIW